MFTRLKNYILDKICDWCHYSIPTDKEYSDLFYGKDTEELHQCYINANKLAMQIRIGVVKFDNKFDMIYRYLWYIKASDYLERLCSWQWKDK